MLRVYCSWPGRVGDDEAPLRGREVAVGDVDRDALLALGAQAVGQQRQVEEVVAHPLAGLLDVRELVGEHLLGVVEQAPDQRALAVVDRARRGEAQQVGRALGQPAEDLGSRRLAPSASPVAAPAPALPFPLPVTTLRRSPGSSSEVPLPLAILHRRLRDAVVGARLPALGDLASRRSPRRPRSSVAARDSHRARAAHVADGAVAHASPRTARSPSISSTNGLTA